MVQVKRLMHTLDALHSKHALRKAVDSICTEWLRTFISLRVEFFKIIFSNGKYRYLARMIFVMNGWKYIIGMCIPLKSITSYPCYP